MENLLTILASSLVALLISIFGYAKGRIDNKRVHERLDSIVDVLHSEESNYYINCPKCGTKILLVDVEINADRKEGNT